MILGDLYLSACAVCVCVLVIIFVQITEYCISPNVGEYSHSIVMI